MKPDLLPLPATTSNLIKKFAPKGSLQHPSFFLSKFVCWHEGWKDEGRNKNSPRVKPFAFKLALDSINSEERQKICKCVRMRRRNWLMNYVENNRARVLRLKAISDVIVNLVSSSPIELGLALHHVYGFPILPASSIKGLARRSGEGDHERLYGDQECIGGVTILDGIPVKYDVRPDIMTPHFSGWYQGKKNAPDDTESPLPIPFISVASGSTFEIALVARNPETAVDDIDDAIIDLKLGLRNIGLGAKTAAGYGIFEVEESSYGDISPTDAGLQRSEVPAGSKPKHTAFEEKIQQIKALPANPAGQIGPYVDWCLGLTDKKEQSAAAIVIVEKMGSKFVREKAKSKEKWRAIQEAAQH
jgi:CRISPR-associated protein Cmr6